MPESRNLNCNIPFSNPNPETQGKINFYFMLFRSGCSIIDPVCHNCHGTSNRTRFHHGRHESCRSHQCGPSIQRFYEPYQSFGSFCQAIDAGYLFINYLHQNEIEETTRQRDIRSKSTHDYKRQRS
jgi:hypothetical protein